MEVVFQDVETKGWRKGRIGEWAMLAFGVPLPSSDLVSYRQPVEESRIGSRSIRPYVSHQLHMLDAQKGILR